MSNGWAVIIVSGGRSERIDDRDLLDAMRKMTVSVIFLDKKRHCVTVKSPVVRNVPGACACV